MKKTFTIKIARCGDYDKIETVEISSLNDLKKVAYDVSDGEIIVNFANNSIVLPY